MKNYLVLLSFVMLTLGLICSGCHSQEAAAKESAVAEPVMESTPAPAAAPVEAVAEVQAESATAVETPTPAPTQTPPAQGARRGRGRGLNGEWMVQADFNGRQMQSVLTFSRNSEGSPTGYWISFRGMNELKDITFEDGKLSFTQTLQGFNGQTMTSKFAGTLENGQLSGTVSNDRGEYELTGERVRTMPRAVGSWKIKMTFGDREINSTLIITADENRELKGQWQSEYGEHEITEMNYQRRTLTFKRTSNMQGTDWESTFEGTIEGDTLSGVITSEMGEIPVEGERVGAALIGNWDLEITSDRGTFQQRLKVNPDLSGMYGAIPVEKINLQDGQISFNIVMEFGEQTFEMNFSGKLQDDKLTGELSTSMGTQQITGTKIARAPGMRRGGPVQP